jgi:NAD(P)-dependent dehydrogenase (short-subunit alcohol dehydrogenase family)
MDTTMSGIDGKLCMVTGANRGIGKATALGLAKLDARVVMLTRDKTLGELARAEIIASSGNQAVELLLADLSSQASVRRAVEKFGTLHERLHVLINNAGTYRTKRLITEDGIELHFAVNYLAPFLLTNLLIDALKAGAPSRVLNLAGIYHRKATIDFDDLMSERNYSVSEANKQAKLALVIFTYELARRLEETGVTVNCLHPGAVATDVVKSDPDASAFARFFYSLMRPFFASVDKGAEPSLYLATSPEVEGVSGKFFIKTKEAESSPESHDRSVASRLWQASEELTGLK